MRKRNLKEKEKDLERERKILRETLDIIVQENAELKDQLTEIQSNVNENKMQLQEKINSITDKDTAVEMLTNQIDLLKQKFNELQQTRQKMQSLINNNISEDNFNSKGNETTVTGTPNRLMHKSIDDIKNKKDKENKIKLMKENIEKQRKFLENQQEIENEINNLKRDVNFLKEKIDENKNNYLYYQYNYDIDNYFNKNDLNNLRNILNKNSNNDKLMYLVTNTGNVYKIKKRDDLSKDNFINKIELDYIKRYKGNEVVNIREKEDKYINDNDESKHTLYNNNFNNNLEYIIKSSINPNYKFLESDDSYCEIDGFSHINEKNDDPSTRNKQKQKGINSYVNGLLRGSFVL